LNVYKNPKAKILHPWDADWRLQLDLG
jgi:hypothetical protein